MADNDVKQLLLEAIAKAVKENQPQVAEQWAHAYVQFAQAVGIQANIKAE